ncbi:MAG: FGGY-family carbohydrate kinase, partial [Firmicutes bacterium]|nr:FGGY-family carbohydrate kinase [Bacillota bacterium]
MMDKRYVITFDCGTQSTRAMLFDDRGTLVGKAKVAFEPYRSPAPGLAEQDAEFYFDKLCEASNALKAEYPAEFARAEAVSLTTIRDTCVQLDVSGKPVRPVIVWMDRRLADCKKPLPLYLRAALALMGISRTAQSVREQAKCNWLMEHEPDGWARTHKYTMISGYYTYMLTGEYTDSTASQIGHLPFESRRRRWYPKRSPLRNLIDIPEEKMMALVDAGGTLGHITETAAALTGLKAGLPLIAAGSDKGCETLGTGCIDESMASLSFGTAATLQLTTKNYVEPKKFLPAYAAVVKGWYNPEVQVYSGYWMLNWYKNQFASHEEEEAKKIGIPVEEYLNRLVADMEPGCGGLTVLPYWNPMLHLPESRGSVTGFTDSH